MYDIMAPLRAFDLVREILKHQTLEEAKEEIAELENIIATNPYASVTHAEINLKGRFRRAEPVIKADLLARLDYMRRVLKGPWPKD